jgi:hypothetical protein
MEHIAKNAEPRVSVPGDLKLECLPAPNNAPDFCELLMDHIPKILSSMCVCRRFFVHSKKASWVGKYSRLFSPPGFEITIYEFSSMNRYLPTAAWGMRTFKDIADLIFFIDNIVQLSEEQLQPAEEQLRLAAIAQRVITEDDVRDFQNTYNVIFGDPRQFIDENAIYFRRA